MQVRIWGTENTLCSGNLMNLSDSAYDDNIFQVTKSCVNKFPGSGVNVSI